MKSQELGKLCDFYEKFLVALTLILVYAVIVTVLCQVYEIFVNKI